MDYKNKWKIIEPLGEGGQGKVYKVYDSNKFNIKGTLFPLMTKSFETLTSVQKNKDKIKEFESFRKGIIDIIKLEDSVNHYALKVLHDTKDAGDSEKAEERIKKEIIAMNDISHPDLLKIIDYDTDNKWFVSKYYPKKTLVDNKGIFTGDFISSLKALRPLVEGVAELHKKGYVHRDIKPENVFIDKTNNLVLGDFGLIFFADDQHTRVSNSFENVGSRDWMPGWAHGIKIENVKPAFDVFSLGKLLWAMVSNKPKLQLWYYYKSEYNLEEMFPKTSFIKFANTIFKKCIVEEEKDCLTDASALLEEIDKTLLKIEKNADIISENIERYCKVCGEGKYILKVSKQPADIRNFGLNPAGSQKFKIFICNHCGHVQLFSNIEDKEYPAWID